MHPKRIKATLPGQLSSIQIVDGDLPTAIKLWKKMLKENKTIESCYSKKFYHKPSKVRREQLNNAKFLQSKEAK